MLYFHWEFPTLEALDQPSATLPSERILDLRARASIGGRNVEHTDSLCSHEFCPHEGFLGKAKESSSPHFIQETESTKFWFSATCSPSKKTTTRVWKEGGGTGGIQLPPGEPN